MLSEARTDQIEENKYKTSDDEYHGLESGCKHQKLSKDQIIFLKDAVT